MSLPPKPNCCSQSSDSGTDDENSQWTFLTEAVMTIRQVRSVQRFLSHIQFPSVTKDGKETLRDQDRSLPFKPAHRNVNYRLTFGRASRRARVISRP